MTLSSWSCSPRPATPGRPHRPRQTTSARGWSAEPDQKVKVAPSYFVILSAAMSLVAILFIRERSRDDRDW